MSARIKVVRTDGELECPRLDAGLRERGLDLVVLPDGVSETDLAHEVRDAAILLMCYTPVPARVIESAQRLRGIVKYGVGIDAIDIDAAKARRIPVVNVPEYAEQTVAECAFALLLALTKKLAPLSRAMQSEGWAWPEARWLAKHPAPTIQKDWLKPGAYGSAVDFDSYWTGESLAQMDRISTDDHAQFHYYRSVGYFQQTPDPYADLGELVAGLRPGRKDEKERILAINLGLAMDDMAVAPAIYQKAKEIGLGVELPL